MVLMYRRILRFLWRILTAVLVILLTYTTTFVLFPYLDRRLPVFWAVLFAYIVAAYALLPLVSRFWQVVFRPDHIPRYVTTPDGWPADPVNIAIVAKNKRQLIHAMKQSGWYVADKASLANLIREGFAIITNRDYLRAPFSTFYLFGRPFDIGFQMPIAGKSSPRHRHHVRFWQLRDEPQIDKNNHFEYWLYRFQHVFGKKRQIWIGAAIEDSQPIGFRWRNLQLTHHNSHDHTKERDYIIHTLQQNGYVKHVEKLQDGDPFRMRSQNIGTSFVVDGDIKLVTLRGTFARKIRS